MKINKKFYTLLGISLLTACASTPNGPSLMALPGSDKSFDQFRNDDYQCRQFALEQVTTTGTSDNLNKGKQQLYDSRYIQCMYAKDHRVPVYIPFTSDTNKKIEYNKQDTSIPPPPSGPPPPSPPDL